MNIITSYLFHMTSILYVIKFKLFEFIFDLLNMLIKVIKEGIGNRKTHFKY